MEISNLLRYWMLELQFGSTTFKTAHIMISNFDDGDGDDKDDYIWQNGGVSCRWFF